MEPEFRERGFKVNTFPIRTKSELSPKIYQALPGLIRWVKEERIDLIHAHTRITQVMATWVQSLAGIPFVTTAHGFYKRRLGRRFLPAWGERVVAISEPVGSHLQDVFRVPQNRVRVVYNGVDLQDFSKRFRLHDPLAVKREYGIPEKAEVAGVTARLVPDKGHEYLIRALKKLESEIPQLHLLIVGEGRYRIYLEDIAKRLGLGRRVYFTGNIKDVSKPLAAMDVFILPAVWREGFGLSIVEAMSCRKPVVVTDIWALNAVVQNGVNGVLVKPRDVEDLAGAIQKVLRDDGFREKISQAGQETAWECFSLDRMVRELESVYEEVVGR